MEQFGYISAFLIFTLIIGGYFFWLTREKNSSRQNGGGNVRLDSELIKHKWLEIGEMMRAGGPANFRQAIVESDKLVDMVLKTKVSGETMGERLRSGRNLFKPVTYDNLWTAHKLRNKVVHEAEFEGLSSDAKTAVKFFEQALKELKVL